MTANGYRLSTALGGTWPCHPSIRNAWPEPGSIGFHPHQLQLLSAGQVICLGLVKRALRRCQVPRIPDRVDMSSVCAALAMGRPFNGSSALREYVEACPTTTLHKDRCVISG